MSEQTTATTDKNAAIQATIDRIAATPLVHPPYDGHEACFHGVPDGQGSKPGLVRVRIVRALRSKSGSGSDQIWVEGVVTGTHKLDCSPSQYPKDNPEGWSTLAYGEEKIEMPMLDAEGNQLYQRDENGVEIVDETGNRIPKTDLMRPLLGYRDVTGYRFVYAGTLAKGVAGEMCINNLRLLGWKPGRVKAPLTAMATTDFVPADGAEAVSAEDLGMTGEFTAGFTLKAGEGNFAPRIQLSFFKLADVKVTRQEAATLDSQDWMAALLQESASGKVDSRRKPAASAGRTSGAGQVGAAPPAAASSARQVCAKPCGDHGDPCKLVASHAGACEPPPF